MPIQICVLVGFLKLMISDEGREEGVCGDWGWVG